MEKKRKLSKERKKYEKVNEKNQPNTYYLDTQQYLTTHSLKVNQQKKEKGEKKLTYYQNQGKK